MKNQQGPMCRISAHEVSSALEKMKIGKASGPFLLVAEMVKAEKGFGIGMAQRFVQ